MQLHRLHQCWHLWPACAYVGSSRAPGRARIMRLAGCCNLWLGSSAYCTIARGQVAHCLGLTQAHALCSCMASCMAWHQFTSNCSGGCLLECCSASTLGLVTSRTNTPQKLSPELQELSERRAAATAASCTTGRLPCFRQQLHSSAHALMTVYKVSQVESRVLDLSSYCSSVTCTAAQSCGTAKACRQAV